jgi:hypothetical protein
MAVLTNDILFKPTESLDRVGNTKGDLLVRDTTEWEVVSAGAAGKVLTSNGATTLPTWETPSSGGLADGDYGDITVSGTGTVLTIDNDVVTYAKMQNVSAADKLLGRGNGGGAGDVQEITLGTNLSLTGTTLNAASGSSYTDEMAQDAVGAMIDASLTYVDGTPLLQRSALTGDVTASAGSNATTIANSAVTFAKIQNISTDTLIGRDTAGTGVATEINVGNGIQFTGGNAIGIAADGVDFTMLQNIATDTLLGRDSSGTGNVEEIELTAPLAFDGAGNIKISDDGITYALMQNISASKQVLGRNSSGAGDVQEVTLDQLLDWVSASVAQGDVLYRGASSWARLAAGTSGLFLRTSGTSANPSWAAPVLVKRKTADETVTSSTTLQDDDHLVVAIEAGCNYIFSCFLSISANSTYGSKYDFSVPSGASGFFTASSIRHNQSPWVTRQNAIGTGTGTTFFETGLMVLTGWVENPTNAGNFTLRWAQSTSSGTALTIQKTSFMTLTRI